MTDITDTRLAELLCARLCHDLASPLGAASAGLELLEGGGDAETVDLVAASMEAATARLKFLRAALGPASDVPHAPKALGGLMRSYLSGAVTGGIALDWECTRPEIDGETGRLLLNLVLIARDSLPRGGTITARCGQPTAGWAGITVQLTGEGMGLSAEARLVLDDGAPPAGPRGAQAGFAVRLASAKGLKIKLSQLGGGISLTV